MRPHLRQVHAGCKAVRRPFAHRGPGRRDPAVLSSWRKDCPKRVFISPWASNTLDPTQPPASAPAARKEQHLMCINLHSLLHARLGLNQVHPWPAIPSPETEHILPGSPPTHSCAFPSGWWLESRQASHPSAAPICPLASGCPQ